MANKGSRAATSRLGNSGGQISPSYVGLKAPIGDGEIQPMLGEPKAYEYEAASEPPNTWVRAIRSAVGSQMIQVNAFILIYQQ
jgi:hypothetical protein